MGIWHNCVELGIIDTTFEADHMYQHKGLHRDKHLMELVQVFCLP